MVKNGHAPGFTCLLCLTEASIGEKIFSKTTRQRALIFGVQQQQVDLNQVCSNYTHWVKKGPMWGYMFMNLLAAANFFCSQEHGCFLLDIFASKNLAHSIKKLSVISCSKKA